MDWFDNVGTEREKKRVRLTFLVIHAVFWGVIFAIWDGFRAVRWLMFGDPQPSFAYWQLGMRSRTTLSIHPEA